MATILERPTPELTEDDPKDRLPLIGVTSCGRCGGLMVEEPCVDFSVRRCVQCGDVVDPVILDNRRRTQGSTTLTRGGI